MHVKTVRISSFKIFSDLAVCDLPETARLVVMVGPNGCGKSSVFDAFHMWLGLNAQVRWQSDTLYYQKDGLPAVDWSRLVHIEFHEPIPSEMEERRKSFYIRSAYRNQADFTVTQLQRMLPQLERPRVQRLVDNDASVEDNYKRLVAATIDGVYSGTFDDLSVQELRERFIGQVQDSMSRVFDQLILKGTGDPLDAGSFYFEKGISENFHYKNLSGGEKAAFDVLLDLILKRRTYDNTVFCIDEPEAHMHTRLQARLLDELVALIPPNSQLWIATHSIGMTRRAKELQEANSEEIVFLDFYDKDFDQEVTLVPAKLDRDFWSRTLEIALDDLANLVAPKQVVLCEGKPSGAGDPPKAEFDAKCYRQIFAKEYPDTDFVSVGNASDVRTDRLQIGRTIQALISGTTV